MNESPTRHFPKGYRSVSMIGLTRGDVAVGLYDEIVVHPELLLVDRTASTYIATFSEIKMFEPGWCVVEYLGDSSYLIDGVRHSECNAECHRWVSHYDYSY